MARRTRGEEPRRGVGAPEDEEEALAGNQGNPNEQEEEEEEDDYLEARQVMNQDLIDALGSATQRIVMAIDRAVTAMGTPGGAAPPGGNPFIRTPLQARTDQTLDFHQKEGRKYYENATRSLFSSSEDKFDVEPSKFQLFITLLLNRAKDLGMLDSPTTHGNAMLPKDPRNPTDDGAINIIKDYGRAQLEDITKWEKEILNQESRMSQNSKILFDLLMNSLTAKGAQRIQIWRSQYTVDGMDAGACLFKIIVRESYLDSNATVSTIRLNLTNLDEYIRENGSDLVAFNAYVQSQVDGLKARGHNTSDLVVNLFKGYRAVEDDKFKVYLQGIENSHEDGSVEVDAPTLMLRAVNFYKTRLTRNEWEQPTEQQKEVLALQTQVESLKKQQNRAKKTATDGKRQGNQENGSSSKPPRPNWLRNNVPPKEGSERRFRTWNNAKWWWCGPETGGNCGGGWRTHQPSECRSKKREASPSAGKKKEDGGGRKKSTTFSGKKRKQDAIKLAVANETIMSDDEDKNHSDAEDSEYST